MIAQTLPGTPFAQIRREQAQFCNRARKGNYNLLICGVEQLGALRKKIHYNPDTKEDEAVISFVDGVVGLYAMAEEDCDNKQALKKLRRLHATKSEGTPFWGTFLELQWGSTQEDPLQP